MTSACCKGYNCCKRNCSQSRLGRSQSVEKKIESLAFSICNIDSNPGLSWAEIEKCEVSISAHHRSDRFRACLDFNHLQNENI